MDLDRARARGPARRRSQICASEDALLALDEGAVLQHLTRREKQDKKTVVVPATDLQLACTIAQTYGWRMQSEILMLEGRQVNLDAASEMGTLSLDAGSTKNEDARVVVLTPQVKSLVEAQLGRVEAFQKRTGTITPYLFVHTQGEHQGFSH